MRNSVKNLTFLSAEFQAGPFFSFEREEVSIELTAQTNAATLNEERGNQSTSEPR
jgi:hypothetical protein